MAEDGGYWGGLAFEQTCEDSGKLCPRNDGNLNEESTDTWHMELDEALLEGFVDYTVIRNICKRRVLPSTHRARVWKIFLNVANRGDALKCWDRKLDLPKQNEVHSVCIAMCANIMDPEKSETMATNLESVITFYCKSRAAMLEPDSAWIDILRPIVSLQELNTSDMYNCFYAVVHRYIPKTSTLDAPYNLFRLILLYHDPELCSFLDSRKVTFRSFMEPWFRSLFASCCKLNVTQFLWDIYFQCADPFFMFFLALVILVNAREQIINTMTGNSRPEIVRALSNFPTALEPADIEDFCQLAMYFADKTPQSVRKIHKETIFGGPATLPSDCKTLEKELGQSLCLLTAVSDIFELCTSEDDRREQDRLRYFLVDCRSPDLYNAGHLKSAFHFDAALMMKESSEFVTAVEALFQAQQQAIYTASAAGGEHLCLIGTGVEEEDRYIYMVISHLLKNHHSRVSMIRGGFESILKYLADLKLEMSDWIAGSGDLDSLLQYTNFETTTSLKNQPEIVPEASETSTMQGLVKTFTSTLKNKSQSLKEKVAKIIDPNPDSYSRADAFHQSKVYRGTQPIFSIGDEEEQDSMGQQAAMAHVSEDCYKPDDIDVKKPISLEAWMKEHAVEQAYKCYIVSTGGAHLRACLVVVGDELFCLREYKEYGKFRIVSTRPLSAVTKITCKKSCPELVTFRFKLSKQCKDGISKDAVDRYFIPEAGLATRDIKQQIVRVLEAAELPN